MIKFVVFAGLCAAVAGLTAFGKRPADAEKRHRNRLFKAEGISNLKLLHVVSRSGGRAPISTYWKDPHSNYTFPPYGRGQLTTDGRKNQFEIGQFLRRRYDTFLGDVYHPDIVAVETTETDRSIMSAQLQMAGMWRPYVENYNKGLIDLVWQPISMKIDPWSQDKLHLVNTECLPIYSRDHMMHLLDLDRYMQYQGLMRFLKKHSGNRMKTADDVANLYNILKAEETFGLELPEWTKKVYPEEMENLVAAGLALKTKTPALKRISGGPLLKKILDDSKAAESGTLKPEDRILFMYGGHTTTVVNLLSTLGVWDMQLPGYGTAVLLEVHEHPNTHTYGLKVLLRNSTKIADPVTYPLEIPNCGVWCPLEQVEKLYSDVLPDDIRKECNPDNSNHILSTPGTCDSEPSDCLFNDDDDEEEEEEEE